MKFVDRTKLEVELLTSGMKIKDLADELSITYAGIYNKIKKNRDFSENEIFILCQLFGTKIFFIDNSVINLRTNNNGSKKKKTESN